MNMGNSCKSCWAGVIGSPRISRHPNAHRSRAPHKDKKRPPSSNVVQIGFLFNFSRYLGNSLPKMERRSVLRLKHRAQSFTWNRPMQPPAFDYCAGAPPAGHREGWTPSSLNKGGITKYWYLKRQYLHRVHHYTCITFRSMFGISYTNTLSNVYFNNIVQVP